MATLATITLFSREFIIYPAKHSLCNFHEAGDGLRPFNSQTSTISLGRTSTH